MARELIRGQFISSRITTLDGTPDATPTVSVYADTTLLGSATVTADGTDSYRVSYSLPNSGLADYMEIWGKVEYAIDSVAVAPQWIHFGTLIPKRIKDVNIKEIASDDHWPHVLALACEEGVLQGSIGYVGQEFAISTRTNLATELARIDTAISSRAEQELLEGVDGEIQNLYGAVPNANDIASAVWSVANRTLTTISDSSGITTLLSRITGVLRTKSEDDAADAVIVDKLPESGRAATPADVTITVDGGGDATAANQAAIADAIAAVKAKTDLLGTASVTVSAPVTELGDLNPLIIGDDYLQANGRHLAWSIEPPAGAVLASSACRFGLRNALGVVLTVTGTISESDSDWVLSFDVARSLTASLTEGTYQWSAEVVDSAGSQLTQIRGSVRLQYKSTR